MTINESNGCWVDVCDRPTFKRTTRRLYGPAEFPGIRVGEAGGGKVIQSVRVGPNAYVQCYAAQQFHDSVFWLLPCQVVSKSRDLQIERFADSIRLFDRPPFAYEPGYGAYMLWAAGQVARASSLPSRRRAARKLITAERHR